MTDEERAPRLFGLTYMTLRRLRVTDPEDRFAAAAAFGAIVTAGVPAAPRFAETARLVACELTENLVRHAGGGLLELALARARADGVWRVSATDQGRPLRNLLLAFADGATDEAPLAPDGYSRRRGIGAGLGALRRLCEALLVEQSAQGKVFRAFLRPACRVPHAGCPVYVCGAPSGGPRRLL